MRASHPTLVVASRAISTQRDAMVLRWGEWLGSRMPASRTVARQLVERHVRLILDVLATLVGPLRREAKTIWSQVTEHYGRLAAARGLAAGEVVEEMQYLRELLIRHLAPALAALRPRQGMALLLRLNRLVDRGVVMAVVGYTDALVQTLLPGTPDGPVEPTGVDGRRLSRELEGFETSLSAITAKQGADSRSRP